MKTAIDHFVKDLQVILTDLGDNEITYYEFSQRLSQAIFDAKMIERMQIIEAYYEADLVGGIDEAKQYYAKNFKDEDTLEIRH